MIIRRYEGSHLGRQEMQDKVRPMAREVPMVPCLLDESRERGGGAACCMQAHLFFTCHAVVVVGRGPNVSMPHPDPDTNRLFFYVTI